MAKLRPFRVYHNDEPHIAGAEEGSTHPLLELPVVDTRQEAINKIHDLPKHLKGLHVVYMEDAPPTH